MLLRNPQRYRRYQLQCGTEYSVNANTTAQTQKILDAITANRMADMQNQINQLQLAQATSGLLRYPNQWTYTAGQFPPIFGGCCGGNNI